MAVIDASVWVSAFVREEPDHLVCRELLRLLPTIGEVVSEPTILLAEVGGALARRTNDPGRARLAVANILADRSVQLHDVNRSLAVLSAQSATELRIRGYDAAYVALARSIGTSIITLDRQLLDRSSSIADSMLPETAVERFSH